MARDRDADQERARAVAVAALDQAAQLGVALPDDLRLWDLAGSPASLKEKRPDRAFFLQRRPEEPGEGLAGVLEAATPALTRRANGLHVTPRWLADHLVELALDGLAVPPPELTVCDPACGGAAFLLAAARALHRRGVPRIQVVRHLLWGADVDPVGLAAAEAALALWAGESPPPGHLVQADALMRGRAVWPRLPREGCAVVIGNPPFLSQLDRATVRSRKDVQRLRHRYGAAVLPYTDAAWLFLLLGVELARPGGRVALVQPLSVVGARDAAAVRAALAERAALRQLWVEQHKSFAASVQVCAPVLQVAGVGETGPAPRRDSDDWADRLADSMGVPRARLGSTRRLADLAQVTAGFRDEYYGLVPLVREARRDVEERPLVTSGVLDWGRCAWGERPARFAKRSWAAPVVDLDRADPTDESAAARGGARWIERVSAPKVVVATQTRVVEAAVDESGRWIPSVPTLAVLPERSDDLWLLAAAIAAPSSTAWLFRRAPGTALSRGALKVAARDLADLPLPPDTGAWNDAATALRSYAGLPERDAFEAFVAAAAAAYGAPDSLVAWWRGRLP